MDYCKNCDKRGDVVWCEATECELKGSWYISVLMDKPKIKKVKRAKKEIKPNESLSKSLKFLLKDNGGSVI